MPYHEPAVVERREHGELAMLTLHSPELARAARPGHYALARCAPADSADPLLRRAVFLADAEPAAGLVRLLVDPAERGAAWLAARPAGERLDLFGPLGAPFSLDGRTRNLLLAGAGPALPALIFLARFAAARGLAIVLLAAAARPGLLPPPYVLPGDVEYQSSGEGEAGLIDLMAAPLAWADQLCAALPEPLIPAAAGLVRGARLRWERGFAQAAVAGPMPCGAGACQACLLETRDGLRARCKDGPVFDLRDLR